MSCEQRRDEFIHRACQNHWVAAAFGGAEMAEKAMGMIYNTARNAPKPTDPQAEKLAENRTRTLFARMKTMGIDAPIHRKASGLPKKDSVYGYAALQETLDAVNKRDPLPPLALSVAQRLSCGAPTRIISAINASDNQKGRCANCGRFTSLTNEHLCPATESGNSLAKKMGRLLKVPTLAYGIPALQGLIDEARTSAGVSMQHILTGELVHVTLDGLPQALKAGFSPVGWKTQRVITKGGIVGVLDATGLEIALDGDNAVTNAGYAYGVALPENAKVLEPVTIASSQENQESGTTAQYAKAIEIDEATPIIASAISPSYEPPTLPVEADIVSISEGTPTTFADLVASEYLNFDALTPKDRKLKKQVAFYFKDRKYSYGSRYMANEEKSFARREIIEPIVGKIYGVTIGRRLPDAAQWMIDGNIEDNGNTVELYSGAGDLVAIYDRSTNTAADVDGNSISGAQLAVVAASSLINAPEISPDADYSEVPLDQQIGGALAYDLSQAKEGKTSLLPLIDGMYLALKHNTFGSVSSNQESVVVNMGGQIKSPLCPNCGKYKGSKHNCDTQHVTAVEYSEEQPAPATDMNPEKPKRRKRVTEPHRLTELKETIPVSQSANNASEDVKALTKAVSSLLDAIKDKQDTKKQISDLADMMKSNPGASVSLNSTELTDALNNLTSALHKREKSRDKNPDSQQITNAINNLADAMKIQGAPQITVTIPEGLIPAFQGSGANNGEIAGVTGALRDATEALTNAVKSLGELTSDLPAKSQTILESMTRIASSYSQGSNSLEQLDKSASKDTPIDNEGRPKCPFCKEHVDLPHKCPERPARQGAKRKSPEGEPKTPQEHILNKVVLPAPDLYLSNLPVEYGGQRLLPLQEAMEEVDSNFELNAETQKVLKGISAVLQLASRDPNNKNAQKMMSFGLYGHAAAGKNKLAEQLAASIKLVDENGTITQGTGCYAMDVSENTTENEAIGSVVLESDGKGGTRSAVRLSKAGLAAAMGGVVAINEIVRNPKLMTAFQDMCEQRMIRVNAPEGGIIDVPVHPSTVFVFSWNPGYEGNEDRPGNAGLSRLITFKMSRPSAEENKRRAASFFRGLLGKVGKDTEKELEESRKSVLTENFEIPENIEPTDDELNAASMFIDEVDRMMENNGNAVGMPEIGARGRYRAAGPGTRELIRFVTLGKTVGWKDALNMFQIYCDQTPEDFTEQWDLIEGAFTRIFGASGNLPQSSQP
ncbi:MAG: hypothetical protein AB9888_13035 [Bacteroidales bacterium]